MSAGVQIYGFLMSAQCPEWQCCESMFDSISCLRSLCPTFAAVALFINNARWDGVPFLLKAGKALESRRTEIRVQFRHVPGNLFRDRLGLDLDRSTNELVRCCSCLAASSCTQHATTAQTCARALVPSSNQTMVLASLWFGIACFCSRPARATLVSRRMHLVSSHPQSLQYAAFLPIPALL